MAVIAEAKRKKKASRMKKSRRKYRALEATKMQKEKGLGAVGKEDGHGKSDDGNLVDWSGGA